MKNPPKPNISPLEIEIENKLRDGYLFSVLLNSPHLKLGQLLKAVYVDEPTTETNHLTKKQNQGDENK